MATESTRVSASARLPYYLVVAAIAGASIVAFAVMPTYLAGVVGLVAILTTALVDRIAHRSVDTRPEGAIAVCYFIFGALVYLTSLLLTATVAKNPDASWLAWSLGGLVFLVISIAAWVPNRHQRPAE